MAALGRYIVMLGFAGARTALTLAKLHREEVQQRFPKHFLKQEEELHRVVKHLSEWASETGKKSNEPLSVQATVTIKEMLQEQGLPEVCLVALRENEVFPALWELAESLESGLDAELRKIPMLQFVIETSELFDANPYVNMTALENRKCFREMIPEASPGIAETAETERFVSCDTVSSEAATVYSLLIATDEPEAVTAFAEANELPSAVIGRLTDKNDRIVRNGEIIRYLTPEG